MLVKVLKYASVYVLSVILMYILQGIYIHNCLHWYSFLFTSGSYTCIALEKVISGYAYNFGNILNVNILHIGGMVIPFLMSYLPDLKTNTTETKETNRQKKNKNKNSAPQSSTYEYLKDTFLAGSASILLGGKEHHLQRDERPVDCNTDVLKEQIPVHDQ